MGFAQNSTARPDDCNPLEGSRGCRKILLSEIRTHRRFRIKERIELFGGKCMVRKGVLLLALVTCLSAAPLPCVSLPGAAPSALHPLIDGGSSGSAALWSTELRLETVPELPPS